MKEAELSAVIREGVCFLWTWRLYTLASIPHSHIVLALKASCHACLITGESRHSEAPPFLAAEVPCIFLSSYLGSCLVKKPHYQVEMSEPFCRLRSLGTSTLWNRQTAPLDQIPPRSYIRFCTLCALIGLFVALISCLVLVVLHCMNTTNWTVVWLRWVAARIPDQANTEEQTQCNPGPA